MITRITPCLIAAVVFSVLFLPAALGDAPEQAKPAPGSEAEAAEKAGPPEAALPDVGVTLEKGLTLQQCIQTGLRNNLGLRSASFTPRIAATAIIEAKANFDTVYKTNYTYLHSNVPADMNIELKNPEVLMLKERSNDVTSDLTQNLLTGGSIDFGFHTTHMNTNSALALLNPRSDSDLHFTIVQNILKGFGPAYNRAPIDKAENDKRIEDLRFNSAVLDVVYGIEKAYWDYVGYVYDLRVRDEYIKVAEQTVSDVEKRVQAGKMFEVDLLEAQEDLANQKLARLETAQQVADAREALVRLIEPYSDTVRWNMDIYVPIILVQRQFDADMNKHVHIALANRPEMLQAQTIIDSLKIDEMTSKNEMLPTLNVGYEMIFHGIGQQTDDSDQDISIDRQVTNEASAYFEYPLFNRAAKSAYLKARYNLDRAFIDTDSLRMDIIQDVRSAVRNAAVTKDAIDAAQLAFELSVKKLAAEERRLEQGRSTLKDVLEFREGKIRSEVLRNRAKVGYEQAIDRVERATATSLMKYDIDITRDQIIDTAYSAGHTEAAQEEKPQTREPDGKKKP